MGNKFPVHNTNDGKKEKERRRRRRKEKKKGKGSRNPGPSAFWADLVLGRVGFGPTWFGPSWFWAELTREPIYKLYRSVALVVFNNFYGARLQLYNYKKSGAKRGTLILVSYKICAKGQHNRST